MNPLFTRTAKNQNGGPDGRAPACLGHDCLAALLSLALAVAIGLLIGGSADAGELEDPARTPASEGGEPTPERFGVHTDRWVHGPSLKLFAMDGPVRPFVMGGGGIPEAPWQADVPWPWSPRGGDLLGRVGGGFDVELAPTSIISLQGSYVQGLSELNDPDRRDQGFGTVGARFELRF